MNDRSDSRAIDSSDAATASDAGATNSAAAGELSSSTSAADPAEVPPVPLESSDGSTGADASNTATAEQDSGPIGGSRGRNLRVAGALVAVVAVMAAGVWWLWPARRTSLVLHGGTAAHIVTVTAGHRVGTSEIGIELTDRSGNPVSHAMIEVQAVEPRMGYAGESIAATDHGAGTYRAPNVPFMMTGPWQLRLSITTVDGADNLSLPLWIGG